MSHLEDSSASNPEQRFVVEEVESNYPVPIRTEGSLEFRLRTKPENPGDQERVLVLDFSLDKHGLTFYYFAADFMKHYRQHLPEELR